MWGILADHQCDRTMCIDMISSVLRIVFYHKDCGVVPIGAMRDGINNASECQIVVSNRGPWRRLACPCPTCVIVWEPQLNELRQFFCRTTSFHRLVKLAKEFVSTQLIGVFDCKIRI